MQSCAMRQGLIALGNAVFGHMVSLRLFQSKLSERCGVSRPHRENLASVGVI